MKNFIKIFIKIIFFLYFSFVSYNAFASDRHFLPEKLDQFTDLLCREKKLEKARVVEQLNHILTLGFNRSDVYAKSAFYLLIVATKHNQDNAVEELMIKRKSGIFYIPQHKIEECKNIAAKNSNQKIQAFLAMK
ncbi:MAG: hypothetical protein CMP11_08225 [Zetaproteobacteria bacterium]|nr:hypothetical protein [Pseudobdellovibrionaceae bacterium]